MRVVGELASERASEGGNGRAIESERMSDRVSKWIGCWWFCELVSG